MLLTAQFEFLRLLNTSKVDGTIKKFKCYTADDSDQSPKNLLYTVDNQHLT